MFDVEDRKKSDDNRQSEPLSRPIARAAVVHHPSGARLFSRNFLLLKESLSPEGGPMPEKPNVILPGTVEKIIPSPHPSEPEKAQIGVNDGDDLYKEIRIENVLQDENGNEVALKEGAEVEVTVEAD
jgi:hypothetical protein